jgi:heme exporter protein D
MNERPGEESIGRRKAAKAVKLWAAVTLSLVSILGALTIWHLVRRGRVLRDQLGPARDVRLPELPVPDESPP